MSQETVGLLVGLGLLAVAILAKLALDRWHPVPKNQAPESHSSGLDLFKGMVVGVGGLAGCLAVLVAALAGLFALVWLVKRMWEAA